MRPTRYTSSQHLSPEVAMRRDFRILTDLYEMERLRQVLRRELAVHTGQRTLAAEIGISRGSLRKFVDMQSMPTHRTLQLIREWAANRPDARTPLGAVALAVLVMDVRLEARGDVRGEVARLLEAAHVRIGQPVPPWVAAECEAWR
ncbi:MAG TPA: hypothetical protein VF263_10445 [Longimicrobiaceae bacterium]